MWNRFSGNGGSKTASRGLRAVDDLTTAVLATLSDRVAIVDGDGNIVAVNKAWRSFDCECGDVGLQRSGVGSNYLEVCDAAERAGASGVEGAALGLRAVLEGSKPHFSLTYICHSGSGRQWYRMSAAPVGSPSDGAVISHASVEKPPLAGDAALTATTGEPFLRVLTENLAKTIGARFAFLSEVVNRRPARVRLIALWSGEGFEENFEYDLDGTPCQDVLNGDLCLHTADVQESFPNDAWLKEIGAECYLAVPLFSSAGEVIGHVGVIHDQRLDDLSTAEHVLRAVGAQASTELERMRLMGALQKSERTGRALLNATEDSALLVEPDGTIIDLNEVAAVGLRSTVEEAAGSNIFGLLPPELAATRRAAMDKVMTSREPLRMDDERDGMHFESSVYPVLDPQGEVEAVAIFASNVTARKVAEAQLRQSEENIRSLVESANEGIVSVGSDSRIELANSAAERMFGYGKGELDGQAIESLVPESYRDQHVGDRTDYLSDPHPRAMGKGMDLCGRRKDGSEFPVEVSLSPVKGSDGVQVVAMISDITERKRAEDALRESEEMIRSLVGTIPHGVEEIDTSGVITFANAAYHRQYEFSDGELIGKSILDFVAADSERETLRDYLQFLVKEQPSPSPYLGQKRTKSGKIIDVEVAWDYRRDEQGQITGFVSVITDITAQKKAEEELALQARVLDNMAEGVSVCDENARILVTNPTLDEMFGYERGELINQHASVLNAGSPEENARVLQDVQTQLEQAGSWRGEFNSIRKDGTQFTTSARISTLEVAGRTYLIAVQEDITERKRVAEDLRLSAERNASLLGAIPDMIFSVDRRGMYVGFVPGEGVDPYSPTDEFLGSTMSEILPTSLAQELMREIGLTLDTGRQGRHQYGLERDDGRHEYEARIVKSKDNEALVIVRDVTAIKRLEQEEQLRRDRDQLEGTVEKEMLGKNPYGLTFREFTVLHLAANGEADKAIADQLGISTFTVSKHVANILGKMAASSRTEACVRALREGLLT